MPDSIQARDLLEMLERIEDKSAYISVQLAADVRTRIGVEHFDFNADINGILKSGGRSYTIVAKT